MRNLYCNLATLKKRWALAAAAVAGTVLLSDGMLLMAFGYTTFGVIVPIVAGAGLISLSLRWSRIHQWFRVTKARSLFWRLFWIGTLCWAVSVAGFCIVIAHSRAPMTAKLLPAHAIVVLGSGSAGSAPSSTLTARLDLALQDSEKNAGAVVVVSGGRSFRPISEAKVMAAYLRKQGLAAERILLEEGSTSTAENLIFSARVLANAGISTSSPIHLITSDFHTLRVGLIAHRTGYTNVEALGVDTPLHIRYNAWLREYFAMVSGWLLNEY
ncbi:YdcF family protein [Variovorax paradoxus]|uniref:YdcF family protein n=1 Tax=Variovorax paradoxus TaxID=34073 RepID=UPI003D64F8F4